LGMVNYLGKFLPNLSQITDPLKVLLKKHNEFKWDLEQQMAFESIKDTLTKTPVLRYYDVKAPVTLSVDASSKALGAVLLQKEHPVAYATKSLSDTEQTHPQIVKEALAIRFAVKKFHNFIWGKALTVETDHKPIETIWTKPLTAAPPRLKRILLDIKEYDPKIVYRRGSQMKLADTLSRNCKATEASDMEQVEVLMITPLTSNSMERFKQSTSEDNEFKKLIEVIQRGWPKTINEVPQIIRCYYSYRDELSYVDKLLFRGERVLVPSKERMSVIKAAHKGHRGTQATIRCAKEQVYWPTLIEDITYYIQKCRICQHTQTHNKKETIVTRKIPNLPFEIIASDIFTYKNNKYLLMVDSYSGFYDFKMMKDTTARAMIEEFKRWFAVHGIPKEFYSDNATYSSTEFQRFAKEWKFLTFTSSPHFPRSNGLAEKYVDIAKRLLKKCDIGKEDIQMALLMSRNTPRANITGTPAIRLFGRSTRTPLVLNEKTLIPKINKLPDKELERLREKQKYYADKGANESKEYQKKSKGFGTRRGE